MFRPKHVGTLTTIFTINAQVLHRFTFGTHLLSTIEIRNVLKGSIMLFKVLCALRVKEKIHKPVFQLARFQWSHVPKMAGKMVLITIIAKSLVP